MSANKITYIYNIQTMKNFFKSLVNKLGYTVIKSSNYQKLLDNPSFSRLWNNLQISQKNYISNFLTSYKSQYSQDLFVISQLALKNIPNYFIEFGATDGVSWSNTYLLEKHFNWSGILCEPARVYHEKIRQNRQCNIDNRCVYSESGLEIEFCETQNSNDFHKISSPELSTMKKYINSKDWAEKVRKQNSINYKVETISLNDLLKFYNAPKNIGYLSIDTEGSELDILSKFDFDSYKISIISVEHNSNNSNRNKLYSLLTKKGYTRIYDDIFGADDIYMLPE